VGLAAGRPGGPVWAWARLDARRRWRSLLGLALLLALASGVMMAASAGARRGGTAVDRLGARTLAATVVVAPQTPGFDWDLVRRLPDVEAVGTTITSVDFSLNIEGVRQVDDEDYWYPADDLDWNRTVERPAVISGRLADPSRVDEATVTASFADRYHLTVGDRLTAHLFSPAQADAFAANNIRVAPAGPRQPLRIVGVVRSPSIDDDSHRYVVLTTYAFTTRYRANIQGTATTAIDVGAVRLRGGEAGLADFTRRLAAATRRDDIQFQNLAEEARTTAAVTGFERNALLVFALAALVASVVMVGQPAHRYGESSAVELGILRGLGLTRGQALRAALIGPMLAWAVGVIIATGAAIAASGWFPIGTAADYEPDPGRSVDLTVIVTIAAVMAVLVGTGAVIGAQRELSRPGAVGRRSAVASAARRLGLPVPVVFGVRYALEPSRGRAAIPARPALLGAIAGVLGVLAALTFHAGVNAAATNPRQFGHTYQIEGWLGYNGQDFTAAQPVWDAFAADPDVVAVNDTLVDETSIAGTSFEVFSLRPLRPDRPMPVVTLSGRMPEGPGEIALAPTTLRAVGVKIGDTVTVGGATGQTRMSVTGTAFTLDGGISYAKGAWTTAAGYQSLFGDSFIYHQIYATLRPGTDAVAVSGRIASHLRGGGESTAQFGPAVGPKEAARLRNIRNLPLALGVFLALLALAAAGHALASAARRRRHDFAVLRSLGLTRRQCGLIVLTQATTVAIVGLLTGLPLGVALGRTVWRAIAESVPVLYLPPTAPLALALAAPAGLLAGVLLAVIPARRAADTPVADALRVN
jgi:FtsX-like permease family